MSEPIIKEQVADSDAYRFAASLKAKGLGHDEIKEKLEILVQEGDIDADDAADALERLEKEAIEDEKKEEEEAQDLFGVRFAK